MVLKASKNLILGMRKWLSWLEVSKNIQKMFKLLEKDLPTKYKIRDLWIAISAMWKSGSLYKFFSLWSLEHKKKNLIEKKTKKDMIIPCNRKMILKEPYLALEKAFITMVNWTSEDSDNEDIENQSLLAMKNIIIKTLWHLWWFHI